MKKSPKKSEKSQLKTAQPENEIYERWKDPNLKNAGNDISGEIKTANSRDTMKKNKQQRLEENDNGE